MSGSTTPDRRLNLSQSGIAATRAVRALHWVEGARLNNWIAGRGSMDVPAHAPGVTIASAGSSTFTYRLKPRYQTTRYAFSVLLTSAAATNCDVTVGGTTRVVRVQERRNALPETLYIDRSSQSDTEASLSITIAPSASGDDVNVECISIEALPRSVLATGAAHDDLGADRLDFFHRQAIDTTNIADQGLARLNDLRDSARRVGIYQHSFGTDSPFSTSSTTFVDVFDEDHEELGRYLYNGDTTRTHSWRVLAYADVAGTKGEVRITNTSGASTVIDVPLSTTSATWLPVTGGSPDTFTCDCEDNTAANGRRRSGGDMHAIQARVTSASGTIYIESISIWEA